MSLVVSRGDKLRQLVIFNSSTTHTVIDSLRLASVINVDSCALVASGPCFALYISRVHRRLIRTRATQRPITHAQTVATVGVDLQKVWLK